jgi:DNA transposition AAA+ family ATPase
MQNRTSTQSNRLSEELKEISADVTKGDRLALQTELSYSKGTISKYLNGNVYDNDTAVMMLKFFRKRIADREKQIAK